MTFTSTEKSQKESFCEGLPSKIENENSAAMLMYFGHEVEIIMFAIKTCNKLNEMQQDNFLKNVRQTLFAL